MDSIPLSDLVKQFGWSLALLIICGYAAVRAIQSIYLRMANRLDDSAQQHLDLIKEQQKKAEENQDAQFKRLEEIHKSHIEDYKEMVKDLQVVIVKNTEAMTILIHEIKNNNKGSSGYGQANHP